MKCNQVRHWHRHIRQNIFKQGGTAVTSKILISCKWNLKKKLITCETKACGERNRGERHSDNKVV